MPATVIAERIGWPTPNSGIDLSTLGATLDVRVNGGNHIRLRQALGPIRGRRSIPSPGSRSLICGRCLVGESATRRGPRYPPMA
jgi:cobalamin biosynthesis protein CobD/CbiB